MTTEEEHSVDGSVLTHAEIECFPNANGEIEHTDSNAFTDSFDDILPLDPFPTDTRLNNRHRSPSASKTVEKLRIIIPAMASPSSYYSSSSESHSPANTKKVRKRYCYKCEIRFKHTADLLAHLREHVANPKVALTELDEANPFYSDYLRRLRKRKASAELSTGALKIRLKIPSASEAEASQADALHPISHQDENVLTSKPTNSKEGTIRILTAQEIKLSPSRMSRELPSDAMVSLGENPFDNHSEPRHFECPPLDGLSQFIDESSTGESTEQLLRKLLENSNVMPEANNFDASSNEFISIENLAHMCTVCKCSFPNSNLLNEHERLSGHNFPSNEVSMLEPIQEMVVEPLLPFPVQQRNSPHLQQQLQHQQIHHQRQQQHQLHHQRQQQHQQQLLQQRQQQQPQVPNHVQHQAQQSQQQQQQQQIQMRRMSFGPSTMPVGSYGQPPVLPIDQIANQVRNMQNNQRPTSPMSSAQRFGQIHLPVRRQTPPPLYRSNPMNMAPFMSMSPDMYNPQPSNQPMGPNQLANSQLASRLMAPMQPPSRLRSRLSMPPQMTMPRPNFQGAFMPPVNNFSPPADLPNGRLQNPQRLSAFAPPQRLKENNRHSPIISMAPPSAGLPIIQSVQSGAAVVANDSNRFQLSNQITLSVKPKEPASANADPNAATNAVNILQNRGILIKPTSKQSETAANNTRSESLKSPKCGTAEEAVQKLQLNNSVSIISKKKSSPSVDAPTIDLSNDEEKESETTARKTPTLARKATIKCPFKSCTERFVNVIALRQHTRTEHRQSSRKMKCAICSTEFPSSIELRLHHLKDHQKSQLGIPVVDLRKSRTRQKLLELGITNFIPIENYTRHTDNGDFGLALPIISIDGASKNNLLNLFGANELSMLPVNNMRSISKPSTATTPPLVQRTPVRPERTVLRTGPPERTLDQSIPRTLDKQLPMTVILPRKST